MNGAWERWWSRISGVLVFVALGYFLWLDAQDGKVDSDILVVAFVAVGVGAGVRLVRGIAGDN